MNAYRRVKADPADWFSADEVEKAKAYQRPLTRLRVADALITLGLTLVIISTHAGVRLADSVAGSNWILRLTVVLAALLVVAALAEMPFTLWREFVHERRWEFSTQTPGRFVADQLKELVMSAVLFMVLLVPLWALIRSTDMWWIAGWLVFLLFSVVLAFLGPIVFMPLFNKFEPLGDEKLAGELRELARTAGLTISGVQVMDASKRTRKDNAFFAGLGGTRRIVLFDNLLEQPAKSVRTVVAHELGHWRRRHIRQTLVIGTALSFGLFLLLRVVSTWDAALDWAGVASIEDPASLPLVVLVLAGGQVALSYIQAWHSRALEREADIESLRLTGDRRAFQDTMRRLMTRNLAELAPSWVTYMRMDHPPPAERLQLAEEYALEQARR
ncbi:MAG TPA: M48 family metallopeptidase [Actinomycetota bacterium]|jgi:STE24 endopeptidase|nr:M48 family metallopeptidase [Actinomycetota bacterium]